MNNILFAPKNPAQKKNFTSNIFSRLENWKNILKGSGVPISYLEAKINEKSIKVFSLQTLCRRGF